jgi:hypothetical protein
VAIRHLHHGGDGQQGLRLAVHGLPGDGTRHHMARPVAGANADGVSPA